MKQPVQADAGLVKKASAPTRSRPTRQAAAPSGRLTQLAAMMNGSTRVQALTQLQDDIQRSRCTQIAPNAAQLKIEIPGALAHSDRISDGLGVVESSDSSSKSSEQSGCGCERKGNGSSSRSKELTKG
jgi:hypothetical protein